MLMTEKVYRLTESQLSQIISNAVSNAFEQLDNFQLIEDGSNKEKKGVVQTTPSETNVLDDKTYQEAMSVMAANRGAGDEPKVGLFWYNVYSKELFGVITHKRSDYTKANAGGGLITCSEMHEDVWKKEFRKQKYRGDGKGPFIGEYQMKPRGRVFYSPKDDQYIIAVGSWIDDHSNAIELIIDEFDLPKEKTVVRKATHWDIGQTWND